MLEGDFSCLDKQGNIILSNTLEQLTTATGKKEERHMGLVLVPVQQQQKVELQVRGRKPPSVGRARHGHTRV